MGVVLLDSSAVVAYLYGDDALHPAAVEAIESAVREGLFLAISAVTWAGLLHGANLGHREAQAVRDFVAEFGIAILPVDAGVAERAAELRAAYAGSGRGKDRPRLRTPDALILATASVEDEVAAVLCGDAKWTKVRGVNARAALLRARKR